MKFEALPVIVALNAYLHDFSVAMCFCAALLAYWWGRDMPPEVRRGLRLLIYFCFAGVVIFGGVRAYFYRDFEMPAGASSNQVAVMLAVKHVILAGAFFSALYMAFKFLREEK